jgi:hypothetical protein
MAPTMMKKATAMSVSSFTTYNSWEMAAAVRPVPRRMEPVLVIRPGEDGAALMISDARSAGSGFEAMVRLRDEHPTFADRGRAGKCRVDVGKKDEIERRCVSLAS